MIFQPGWQNCVASGWHCAFLYWTKYPNALKTSNFQTLYSLLRFLPQVFQLSARLNHEGTLAVMAAGCKGSTTDLIPPLLLYTWSCLGPLNFTGKIQAMALQVNLEATFRKMVGCIHVQPNWHLGKMKVGGVWLSQKTESSDTMHQKTGLSFVCELLWEAKIKAICQSSPFPFQIILSLETAIGGMKFQIFFQSAFSLFIAQILCSQIFLFITPNYLDWPNFHKIGILNRQYMCTRPANDFSLISRQVFNAQWRMDAYISTVFSEPSRRNCSTYSSFSFN